MLLHLAPVPGFDRRDEIAVEPAASEIGPEEARAVRDGEVQARATIESGEVIHGRGAAARIVGAQDPCAREIEQDETGLGRACASIGGNQHVPHVEIARVEARVVHPANQAAELRDQVAPSAQLPSRGIEPPDPGLAARHEKRRAHDPGRPLASPRDRKDGGEPVLAQPLEVLDLTRRRVLAERRPELLPSPARAVELEVENLAVRLGPPELADEAARRLLDHSSGREASPAIGVIEPERADHGVRAARGFDRDSHWAP